MQPPKYQSTGHWRWSPTVHRDDSYHPYPEHFVGVEIVITEKLDGGNTSLLRGEVYARSVDAPATEGWFAMVRKYHAWKTTPANLRNYVFRGEDIYGVHSIEYDAVRPDRTFYMFSVVDLETNECLSWDDVETFSEELGIALVPVVYRGVFDSVEALREAMDAEMKKPSVLGGLREGLVVRLADSFSNRDLIVDGKTRVMRNVCKSVRPDHVQTDQHWRRNWKPCKLIT